jgi:hypothetical protein
MQYLTKKPEGTLKPEGEVGVGHVCWPRAQGSEWRGGWCDYGVLAYSVYIYMCTYTYVYTGSSREVETTVFDPASVFLSTH